MNPNDPQGSVVPEQPQTIQPAQPQAVSPDAVQQLLDQQAATEQQQVPQQTPVVPQEVPQAAEAVASEQQPAQVTAEAQDDGEYEPEDYTDEELDSDPVKWSAQEYIHRDKGTGWFIGFAVIMIVLGLISWFVMHSISFAILLVVIAVVVIVYTRRPPRELSYTLDSQGLTIDNTVHKFSNFKSFGVIQEDGEYSVMLIPTQRFQPGITVYFPEESGEDIVDVLGSRLPMKELKLDAVDRIVRLLRL